MTVMGHCEVALLPDGKADQRLKTPEEKEVPSPVLDPTNMT